MRDGKERLLSMAAFSLAVLIIPTTLVAVQGAGPMGLITNIMPKPSNASARLAPSPANETNVSYCKLLGAWSGLASTNYTTNVTILWGKVCVIPAFVTLIDTWGDLKLGWADNNTTRAWAALNLSFQWGGSDNAPPTVSFVVTWLGPCWNASYVPGPCANSEYWNGNVTANSVSGPFYEEHIPVYAGATPTPVASGFGSTSLWLFVGIAAVVVVALASVLAVRRTRQPPGPSSVASAQSNRAAVQPQSVGLGTPVVLRPETTSPDALAVDPLDDIL
jgi:hypothetical protein